MRAVTGTKTLVKTIFIGGFFTILPIALLLKIFSWVYQWAAGAVSPVSQFIEGVFNLSAISAQLLSFTLVALLCFFVGLVVRTVWGKWLHANVEKFIFTKMPGYSVLKDFIAQFQPGNTPAFSTPVLLSLNDGEHHFMGFVTDESSDGYCTVFVPTSPSPMNGFAIVTTKDKLIFVDTSPEKMMKSVLGCGLDSENLYTYLDKSR
ncbi:MAG: hypothetical protein C9356_10300 [Oleiphilus sp.]|nr:MAG: hypothetical protein C9356_10300 [Oleiphilus sp.]